MSSSGLPIVIHDFAVTSGHYMRRICALFIADNWLWMLLPLAICGILAIWIDVRFVIVAMMVLFVAMPMILALLYFYYGLAPAARWSIMAKSARIDTSGITLTFADPRMQQHTIPWDGVRHIIEKQGDVLLMLRSGRYVCLLIPESIIDPDVTITLRQLLAQAH